MGSTDFLKWVQEGDDPFRQTLSALLFIVAGFSLMLNGDPF